MNEDEAKRAIGEDTFKRISEVVFKKILIADLGVYGFTITEDKIPNEDTVIAVLRGLKDWWRGEPEVTQKILGRLDISYPLWQSGMINEWLDYYTLIHERLYGEARVQIGKSAFDARARTPTVTTTHVDSVITANPANPDEDAGAYYERIAKTAEATAGDITVIAGELPDEEI